MPIVVEHTVQAIAAVVQTVPIGTNIALMRLLWVMMSGGFLTSRGAVFGALANGGLSVQEVRRSWAAMGQGAWESNELLANWQAHVASENRWRARCYAGGYSVLSVDMTGFWRPQLKGWLGRHFHSLAQRTLTAVVFGVLVQAGEVAGKRTPLLQRLIRCQPGTDKTAFRQQVLHEARRQAAARQVLVMDAEFTLSEVLAAQVVHYVVRLAVNCTLRRNELPAAKARGRKRKYGDHVRPVARPGRGQTLPATPTDDQSQFVYEGRPIKVQTWYNLVTAKTPVNPAAATFVIHVFHDPCYQQPLVLATNLVACQPSIAYRIYRDRWTVEQAPLAAKQMVGLHRQFVFARQACFRLPELSLIAGAILTYTAATAPPIPTGFWDRKPVATPGRLRRLLRTVDFAALPLNDPQLRKKNSRTDHLPKGVHAHRRTKPLAPPVFTGN